MLPPAFYLVVLVKPSGRLVSFLSFLLIRFFNQPFGRVEAHSKGKDEAPQRVYRSVIKQHLRSTATR